MPSSIVAPSLPSIDKVTLWLEALPAPPSSPPWKKRGHPLMEMDHNAPAKRARHDNDGPDATFRSKSRAPSLPMLDTKLDELPPKPNSFEWFLPTSGSVDLESTLYMNSNPTQSSKRKREESVPATSESTAKKGVKGLALLQRARYPLVPETFSRWDELPLRLQELGRQLIEISAGRGIVPQECKDELVPWLREHPLDDQTLPSPTRHLLGGSPQRNFVDEIVHFGRENRKLLRSEAAWNGNVHQPLLLTAWRLSTHAIKQRCENVTTATIEPPTLLATTGAPKGPKVVSKKVDFALTLVLDDEESIAQRLMERQLDGLNQSSYEPLRWSPVTTSFETKLNGEGLTSATIQLGTWALAQVAKLRLLLAQAGHPDAEIPPLPLVLIQGSEWRFSFLEAGATKAKQWTYSELLGDTRGARGVFKVVNALQVLIDWGEKVYRPWFLDTIVHPILESPEALEGSV